MSVGIDTGNDTAHARRKKAPRSAASCPERDTPESLVVALEPGGWSEHWREVEHLIVDGVIGAPAKHRAAWPSGSNIVSPHGKPQIHHRILGDVPPRARVRFLVGPTRTCRVVPKRPYPRHLPLEGRG